jgi:hypothetical protein
MHKILYLFIYNTFIKILHMFRAVCCSSSGGLIVYMQTLISSLSVGGSHLYRVTIPETVYIQLDLLKMSSVLIETCGGF